MITWNTKSWTNQLVERPQQILVNYVHISWRALRLIYLAKYFWSLLNSPNLIFQRLLCMSKVSKIYHVKHYDMIVRTKIYVFNEAFLAIFPLELSFWPAQLMFCIIWFSKQKLRSSKRRFHWRILRGIFPVKAARKWRQPFLWILITL